MWYIYGPKCISMHTVFRWVKSFKAVKYDRPKTAATKASITTLKVVVALKCVVVEENSWMSVKYISILERSISINLKMHLKLKKICIT